MENGFSTRVRTVLRAVSCVRHGLRATYTRIMPAPKCMDLQVHIDLTHAGLRAGDLWWGRHWFAAKYDGMMFLLPPHCELHSFSGLTMLIHEGGHPDLPSLCSHYLRSPEEEEKRQPYACYHPISHIGNASHFPCLVVSLECMQHVHAEWQAASDGSISN